jgi:hypothetical protein
VGIGLGDTILPADFFEGFKNGFGNARGLHTESIYSLPYKRGEDVSFICSAIFL